ncbi:MAG: TonB-dependent receptor [Thalassotalea sp.]
MNKKYNKLSWCIATILSAGVVTTPAAAFEQTADETNNKVSKTAVAKQKAEKAEKAAVETITVTGLRQQLRLAAQLERDAKTIQSVITSDDVGNFPDQTLAESLSRLAGVTVEDDEGEGRYITVRGLNPSFVQVTINNAQLGASGAGGGRSVALDVVPGDLFQRVSVGKTLLPDTDHDSFGAKVDLRPLSAFNRKMGTTGRLSLRTQYGDLSENFDPNVRADVTHQLDIGDGRFGVAAALSYSDRSVHGDQLRSTSGGGIASTLSAEQVDDDIFNEDQSIWAIQELDQRMERGSRERLGGTLVFDYEPNDAWRFQLAGIYGTLEDDDIRVQQEVELRDASDSETLEIGLGRGIFSDVDLERQMFFIPSTETTYAIHFESDYTFGKAEDWVLSFAADYSENEYVLGQSNRATWRERDTVVEAYWDQTDAGYTVLGSGDLNSSNPIDYSKVITPADFELSQIGTIEEDRFDEIGSINMDLEHYFDINNMDASFKFGFKMRERERGFIRGELFEGIDTDEEKQIIVDLGVPVTLAGLPTFVPKTNFDINGGIPGGAVFPQIEFAREYLENARSALGIKPTEVRVDYQASENTDAAYFMFTLNILPELEMIMGVRYEKSEYTATGLTERNIAIDRLDPEPEEPGDLLTENLLNTALETTYQHSYENYFPAIHFRYDWTDDVVARFSLSQAQVRPSFGAANGIINENLEFLEQSADVDGECLSYSDITIQADTYAVCSDEDNYNIRTRGGNPFLNPQIADQIDLNVGWYPTPDSNLTAAVYYKDIKDYIIRVNTSDSTLFPLLGGNAIDPLTGLTSTQFSKSVNVSSAKLYGLELSGRYQFVSLPQPFNNFLVSANAVFIGGNTSTPFIADGAKLDLNGMSDFAGNASLAYEVDNFNIQLSARYRTERLQSFNAGEPARNVYVKPEFKLGLSTRYDINDQFRVFANIQNITNERKQNYFQGDEKSGNLVNLRSDFGRTFRVGLDIRF